MKNTYILYMDDDRSRLYMADCFRSCLQFPNINATPVPGYSGLTYSQLCEAADLIAFEPHIKNSDESLGSTFCCSAGHYAIWQMIVDSGEPGVVLEHDVIVKGDYSDLDVEDDEILFLGPRTYQENDYRYDGTPPTKIDIDRFEGTHAYAITPATAQKLIDIVRNAIQIVSVDHALAMHNVARLNLKTLDKPLAVAVVGNRVSFTEATATPVVYNAINTQGFLDGLRPGAKVPPERKLLFTNDWFGRNAAELDDIIFKKCKHTNDQQLNILMIGGYEGRSANWFSDHILDHPLSRLLVMGSFESTAEQGVGMHTAGNTKDLFEHNTRLSRNGYKIVVIDISGDSLVAATHLSAAEFDIVYIDDDHTISSTIQHFITAASKLTKDGVIIIDDYEWETEGISTVKEGLSIIDRLLPVEIIHQGSYIAYKLKSA